MVVPPRCRRYLNEPEIDQRIVRKLLTEHHKERILEEKCLALNKEVKQHKVSRVQLIVPGLVVPGLMVPGLMVPGLMVPGLVVPGLMVPGLIVSM